MAWERGYNVESITAFPACGTQSLKNLANLVLEVEIGDCLLTLSRLLHL